MTYAPLQVGDAVTDLGPIPHPDFPHHLLAATKFVGKGECSHHLKHTTSCAEASAATPYKPKYSLFQVHCFGHFQVAFLSQQAMALERKKLTAFQVAPCHKAIPRKDGGNREPLQIMFCDVSLGMRLSVRCV